MATFTAIGPAVSLDGPLPVAPRHSLLNTPGVVKERDATRVLNGVNVYSYPTGCPALWEPCSDGTFRTKANDSDWPLPRFDAIVVYQGVTCSTISVGGDPEEFFGRIETVLDATLSSGVERALAEGVPTSSNPFFGDGNVELPTGSTAVSAGVALSYLENAIGETCRKGMLHFTPAVIASLQAFPIGNNAADRILETANGTPVVSGDGYIGVENTGGLGAANVHESWSFATGPVEVYLGPVVARSPKEVVERETNVVEYFAERYVLAVWDTALQAAVLVDWTT